MSVVSSSYYGVVPQVQPTGSAAPQPNPEQTTGIATVAPAGRTGVLGQAGFWIVALIAVAVGLVHLSIRFS